MPPDPISIPRLLKCSPPRSGEGQVSQGQVWWGGGGGWTEVNQAVFLGGAGMSSEPRGQLNNSLPGRNAAGL